MTELLTKLEIKQKIMSENFMTTVDILTKKKEK